MGRTMRAWVIHSKQVRCTAGIGPAVLVDPKSQMGVAEHQEPEYILN